MPKLAKNPALFPPHVAQCSVEFDPQDSTDLAEQFPGIPLPVSMVRAVRKRQTEFLAGRYCVREALRACAPEHAEAIVGTGPDREPLWPPGIVGAITHTHHFASAAVARARDVRGIGLDAERLMTDHLAARVLSQIAATDEISALVSLSQWSTSEVLTVVFSAKETLFKCLYREVRRYFDFRDASVIAVDKELGRFSVRLLVTLTPALPAGSTFDGRFERDEGSVCTAMVLPPA
jgi:enterobactin synthetase component D